MCWFMDFIAIIIGVRRSLIEHGNCLCLFGEAASPDNLVFVALCRVSPNKLLFKALFGDASLFTSGSFVHCCQKIPVVFEAILEDLHTCWW